MTKLTVEQDMKLGSALDQLEDAIEAAHAALKMVRWAQLNVARFTGGVLGGDISLKIREAPLDVESLWELTATRKADLGKSPALAAFIESHNHTILDLIEAHNQHGRSA